MNCRTFFSPDMSNYILVTESALKYMYTFVQRNWRQTEAGGEIYSTTPCSPGLVIDTVTGPHPQDRRTRHSCNPDVEATTKARYEEFARDRHAVGLWHTHPEPAPSPSGQDRKTTEEYLKSFGNERDRYLSIIIGNCGKVPKMSVWSMEKSGKWLQWAEFHGETLELSNHLF
jgi:integrative and conjugative element protein (TIGR02256 family)